MSAPEFYPEIHYLPYRGGYLGTYKLFSEYSFKQIPGRVVYPTSGQAETAARAHVARLLNPTTEAERTDHAVELTEIEAWRRQKAADEKAEIERVFGRGQRAIVRDFAGNEVKVERRKRMVRA